MILVHDSEVVTNACAALRLMFLRDPVPAGEESCTPLFRWRSGKPLLYKDVAVTVKNLMQRIGECPVRYSTHSLRIGGATALADAGCPDVIIQTMGRWSSTCYRLYCRTSFDSVLYWSGVMGTHRTRPVANMLPGMNGSADRPKSLHSLLLLRGVRK